MSGNGVAHLVRTGTANMASVAAAVERAGWSASWARAPEDVLRAERVVLPGVGTLAAAAATLARGGWDDALRERLACGRPTLAVCVGMQLLAEGSEESPGVAGLGLLPVVARRLPDTVRVPQLGWNRVEPDPPDSWFEPGHAYFANSYCLRDAPGAGWQTAWSEHGTRFLAAVRRDEIVACQFHPELSGPWGQRLVDRWLAGDLR